jgi:hypothetical protein
MVPFTSDASAEIHFNRILLQIRNDWAIRQAEAAFESASEAAPRKLLLPCRNENRFTRDDFKPRVLRPRLTQLNKDTAETR